MASQYDLLAGLDITALSSVSQSQLLQMVNQAAPLPNIGGVIYDTITPDVASNPRFARYFWLDSSSTPPTIKIYKTTTSSWQAFAPTGESIINTTLAPHVVALDHMFNDVVADGSLADYILVYDSTGKLITQISKENLLSGLKVNLRQLKSTIAEGEIVAASVNQNNFPKYTSDGIVWGNIDLATQMFENKLATSYISPFGGTEDTNVQKILVTNPSKTAASWRSANDSNSSGIFPIGTESVGINISKLKKSGTGLLNVYPRINAAGNWEFGSDSAITASNASLNSVYASIGITGNLTISTVAGLPRTAYTSTNTPNFGSTEWSDTGLLLSTARKGSLTKLIARANLHLSAQSACNIYAALVVKNSLTGTYTFLTAGAVKLASADDLMPLELVSADTNYNFGATVGTSLHYRVYVASSNGAAVVLGKSFNNTINFGSGAFSFLTQNEHV